MLNIYHEKNVVLTAKEIMSKATAAGVVSGAVEGINQELVDDGLVDTDKIGPQNFL